MASCRRAERRGLFERYVRDQHGIYTGLRTALIKCVNTAVEHQVGVHQQANRNIRVLLTDRRQHFETVRWRNPRSESTQSCTLNGWAIGQRIREGDPQLQGICTVLHQRINDL
ncbi:hypothetical protein D3C78_1652510 [compost metagenome]